jgi:hypothetical protein
MFTQRYREYVYKFLERYLFIYNAIADGWRVKYYNKNKIVLYNNVNDINKDLLNTEYFVSYYKNKTSIK